MFGISYCLLFILKNNCFYKKWSSIKFMVSSLGYCFGCLDRFWRNLRKFAYQNRTIFEGFFVFLYAIEQVALIWFAFNCDSLDKLVYIVSIFAVIVLTTFALHKFLMESIIKCLQREVQDEKIALESFARKASDEYQELFNTIVSKNLNISKISNKKRGIK